MRSVTSAGAAAAGLISPELGIAAAAGKELVDVAGGRLFGVIARWRERRASQLVREAAAAAGTDANRLAETIESSPRLLALLSESVQAAMDTPYDAKIRALAGCLARGVRDEAEVDVERLRIRGLARIDEPEVLLMNLLTKPTSLIEPSDPRVGAWPGWRQPEILQELPGFANMLHASIGRLTAEGMVRDDGLGRMTADDGFANIWVLTDFGRDCLSLLQAVGPAPEAE